MNCRETRRCLSPYLDSELDPTTTFAISEHLRTCDGCRRRFDAERGVDQAIVTGLGAEKMPDELWREIVRPLRAPRWTIWRLYAPLAAAAAIALVVWSGWPWRPAAQQPHWVVREFLAETNNGQPFASADVQMVPAGMTMPRRPVAGLVVNFTGEAALRHVVQCVRLDTVRDADGAEIVEVRLNCCGEPVIVRAAKRDQPGRLREFVGLDATRLASLPSQGKVAVSEREVGEYVVVAVSRHPTNELLAAMQVQ
ncbi:MAG: zf-HC2 domain-containing protein [Planctomycetes bacterium]|nr:zf-HC2 domain-containing protein [Planctomycetota bacterium]